MHTAIFEKDGQRFLVNTKDFVGAGKLEAMEIGIGAGFVECIIWDAKFTSEVLDIEQAEADGLQVTEATLGNCPVYLLGRPIDEECIPDLVGPGEYVDLRE